MKKLLNSLHAKAHSAICRAKALLMATLATLLATSEQVMAAMPVKSNPSRGDPGDNFIKLAQDTGYDLTLLIALGLASLALMGVSWHLIAGYHEVQNQKRKWGDYGISIGVGVLMLVLVIYLATKASGVL